MPLRKAFVVALMVSSLDAQVACGRKTLTTTGRSAGKEQERMAETLVLTDADQGTTRAAVAGQEVTVRLAENPTTGYRWALEADPAGAVEDLGSTNTPGGSAPGAGGLREFHLRLKTPGRVALHLKMWREWQGDGSVTERREFLLEVRQ